MNNTLLVVLVVLVILLAFAITSVFRARNLVLPDSRGQDDELTGFQQMRDEGTISEEEYIRMKKIVAVKTVDQVKQDLKSKYEFDRKKQDAAGETGDQANRDSVSNPRGHSSDSA